MNYRPTKRNLCAIIADEAKHVIDLTNNCHRFDKADVDVDAIIKAVCRMHSMIIDLQQIDKNAKEAAE